MIKIEFRAWEKSARQMVDWKTIKKECDRLSLFDNSNFIFMQYIGLRDKNRIKIFDGDIVTVPNNDGKINQLEVKFGVANRDMESGYNVDIPCFYFEINGFPTFPITKNWQNGHDLDTMEVIGNIWENTDLISTL